MYPRSARFLSSLSPVATSARSRFSCAIQEPGKMSESKPKSVDHPSSEQGPEGKPQPGVGKSKEQSRRFQIPGITRFFSQPADSRPRRDRAYYESLTLDDKRKLYKCGRGYHTLAHIPSWKELHKSKSQPKSEVTIQPDHASKVSLWQGDITTLEIDAIVNAANSSLLGGGGVDGAIHRAAGGSLTDECATLDGCSTGDAKLTSGHKLPAKYVIHTVGPINSSEELLKKCYNRCFDLVLENNIRSVAFCCIATGVYGFPNEPAAHIALESTRKWLETNDNAEKMDRIIFCVFLKVDYRIYNKLLRQYFPVDSINEEESGTSPELDIPKLEKSLTEPAKILSMKQQSTPTTSEVETRAEDNKQDTGNVAAGSSIDSEPQVSPLKETDPKSRLDSGKERADMDTSAPAILEDTGTTVTDEGPGGQQRDEESMEADPEGQEAKKTKLDTD